MGLNVRSLVTDHFWLVLLLSAGAILFFVLFPLFAVLLVAVAVFGFFTGGIWSWAPIWLPELFPTRMRATAVAFCFNAPRWISCSGPLIAGTLIVALGGYGRAATLVGLFFIVGAVAAVFLPETNGEPLPETVAPASSAGAEAPLRAG
jgi:MFS family permease